MSNQENESINLAALSPSQMADIIGKAGNQPLDIDQVLEDIEEGAPVDAEGKMHVLHYAAWIANKVSKPNQNCD